MAAINRRTSVIVKVFKGKTPTSRLLSWDTAIAGAFFPQAYVHMPEESVSRQCYGLTNQHGKQQQRSANNGERFKTKHHGGSEHSAEDES
jgi:hypothetical protein